jgi:predicted membrane-bound spermidine synthase
MTTAQQSRHLSISWNKAGAVVAWAGGVVTTYLFFHAAMPELPLLVAILGATVVQGLLTLAERPLWRWLLKRSGGKFAGIAVIVTLIDTLFNAAGIYPFTSRLAQTQLGVMLAEVFNVQAAMSAQPSFFIAFLIGLLVALLPEALWES